MHQYLKPDSEYSKLDLGQRLEKAGLDFIPYILPDHVTHPETGLEIANGRQTVIHPTDTENQIIGTVGADYTLTTYHDLFSKFDQPLLDEGFVPSGCQSFKNRGGARMFYTKPGEHFGARGGHTELVNKPRRAVFFITTGINGFWSTSFGGYIYEQWCSNGAVRRKWADKVGGIRHTKTHDQRLEDALDRFNWIAADMAGFDKRMEEYAKRQAEAAQIKLFTNHLIPDTDNNSGHNQREQLTGWILSEASSRNRAVTFQDLLQGVTAYNTHNKVKSAEGAFERILRGEAVELVERAENWLEAN